MRRVVSVPTGGLLMRTLVGLLVLTAGTAAFADTDFERFDKRAGKYAVQLGGQPKGLCLCRDATLANGVGFLLRGSSPPVGTTGFVTSTIGCLVPGFDENSGALGVNFVCDDFVPLAK